MISTLVGLFVGRCIKQAKVLDLQSFDRHPSHLAIKPSSHLSQTKKYHVQLPSRAVTCHSDLTANYTNFGDIYVRLRCTRSSILILLNFRLCPNIALKWAKSILTPNFKVPATVWSLLHVVGFSTKGINKRRMSTYFANILILKRTKYEQYNATQLWYIEEKIRVKYIRSDILHIYIWH